MQKLLIAKISKREKKIMHLRATNCTSNATYVILENNFVVDLYLTHNTCPLSPKFQFYLKRDHQKFSYEHRLS